MPFQVPQRSVELLHEEGNYCIEDRAHHSVEVALLEPTMMGFALSGWELVATPTELPLRQQFLFLGPKITALGSVMAGFRRAAVLQMPPLGLDSTTLLMAAASWITGSAVSLLRHFMTTDGRRGIRKRVSTTRPKPASPPPLPGAVTRPPNL